MFFEYIEFPEDKKIKIVAYKLKGRVPVWWDRLREMGMRNGCDSVQTWCRMKQLLRGRFLPLDYGQYIFYAYQRCTHGNRRVNDYTAEFFKLVKRNQLPESENQSKALQEEGKNFLAIVHDPSSIMGESVRGPKKCT